MTNPLQNVIATDSTACIPKELNEQLKISQVAHYIHINPKDLRDLISIN
jgi:fatty acid-binding protein DegV